MENLISVITTQEFSSAALPMCQGKSSVATLGNLQLFCQCDTNEEKMGDTEWNPKYVQIYTLENCYFHKVVVSIYHPGILYK